MAIQLGKYVLALDSSDLPSKDLIGGKAWSIARMSALGLRVPPAVVITTHACVEVLETGAWPPSLKAEIAKGIAWIESQTERVFGGSEHPLLVSVRSGAPISMPGMMDTVLNLGINDQTEALLAADCGDAPFARDTHRRFLELYAHIVLKCAVTLDPNGEPETWRSLIREQCSQPVPTDVRTQLEGAVNAVFQSWNSRRAKRYRQHHDIADTLGTAVTIQAMVFGNMDDNSGTGVLFSRNPLSGENAPYGEFMSRAQGEDIVSGKRTPEPLEMLRERDPRVHEELLAAAQLLENENGDVQDIEFTLERGKLYLLQTRAAKRAPLAAVKIAVDMANAGQITRSEAIKRLSPEQVRVMLSPHLATDASAVPHVTGEAASPGVGVGVVVLDSDAAEAHARRGEAVVLARETTSPDDLHGMIAARAIITEQGGSTSHAAVVSRALGRPCVVGCGIGSLQELAGKTVTVDGASGQIFLGALPVVTPSEHENALLRELSEWARDICPITVSDVRPDGNVVDFDASAGEYEPLVAALDEGAIVEGALFANDDDAVAKAIAAGVSIIITSPTLPALISAIQVASIDQ